MENKSQLGYLDRFRMSRGHRGLRREFQIMLKRNRPLALFYINENRLHFPTLFLLLPQIIQENLVRYLSARNRTALDICARRLNWQLPSNSPKETERYGSETLKTLKWMFETGWSWEGPLPEFDDFDTVMDMIAAVLIVTFHDESVLPDVADLIFRRNRKGLYINDLVWSFFQSSDPNSVLLLAKHLESGESPDTELACQLLHLEFPEDSQRVGLQRHHYQSYQSWFRENRPYLYFTGEQFQMTSEPEPLRVDREAKYLQKEISPRMRTPLSPVTEEEREQLNGFRTCAREEQKLLCEYSAKLCREDKNLWEAWKRNPPAQQVMAARSRTEVV